jgi:hypothetical protein
VQLIGSFLLGFTHCDGRVRESQLSLFCCISDMQIDTYKPLLYQAFVDKTLSIELEGKIFIDTHNSF